MTSDLDRLCESKGVERSYISETGEHRIVGDDVRHALIEALGDDVATFPAADARGRTPQRCFLPDWLEHGRAWGVTVQLFGVRSARNQGIGDFEDAARLAELFGAHGADFLGINPVHALFLADPDRKSPYFPSSRRFLNPLYIAIDRLGGSADTLSASEQDALRTGTHIDYAAVSRAKRRALETLFEQAADDADFTAFCDREGTALDDFATFEALSEWLAASGHGAGWHGWPSPVRSARSDDVTAFRRANASRIRFHKWLQWVASRQLADAQHRACRAGMRIGLYLDLAVGVAPDGAATWAQPESYARTARIGAPPDLFNSAGQDWGLAPLKPAAVPHPASAFATDLTAAMRSAGAVRLDHAMGLQRLYWIPEGHKADRGGYVRYPFEVTLDVLAGLSQKARAIVIGEDLGTVPHGFREIMEHAGLLGYRVFYFETQPDGLFRPPQQYAAQALACVSTHDLPPLAGWWTGRDIDARARLGLLDADTAAAACRARGDDRLRLLKALIGEGIAPRADEDRDTLTDDILIAVHAFLARTPCRLVAIQLEDLAHATEQVNLPGTDREHPNWSLRLPLTLDQIADDILVRRTLAAVATERPRPPA